MAGVKRQIMEEDGTTRFDLSGNGTVFINCPRLESIPEPVAITGITIVDNSGFVGTRKEFETPVFDSRIVKRNPD